MKTINCEQLKVLGDYLLSNPNIYPNSSNLVEDEEFKDISRWSYGYRIFDLFLYPDTWKARLLILYNGKDLYFRGQHYTNASGYMWLGPLIPLTSDILLQGYEITEEAADFMKQYCGIEL
jgi:hypothetical protein